MDDGRLRTRHLALLLAAILAQSCQSYVFQAFNYDKVAQASAGQAWLDGHGFQRPVAAPETGAAYAAVAQWPPGYSLAWAAAISITGEPYLAGFLIELAAGVVFFVAWAQLLRQFASHTFTPAFLYWTAAASAITHLPASDLVALAAYSAALAAAASALREGDASRAALAGLAAGVAGAVRFAYWPLAWIPIAPLLWARRPNAWRGAAAYFAAAAVPLAWATTAARSAAAGAPVIPNLAAGRGPYFSQAWPLPPLGAVALGVDEAWRRLAVSLAPLRPLLGPALWLVTFMCAAVVFVVIRRLVVRDRATDDQARVLGAWGTLTFVVTTALVAALALFVPAYPDGWTYMTDAGRYLAPAYPFLVVALVSAAVSRRDRVSIAAAALLIVAGGSVCAYRVGQLSLYATRNAARLPSGSVSRRELRAVFAAVRASTVSGAREPVVYCDAAPLRRAIAAMAGAAASERCDIRAERVLQARTDPDGVLVEIAAR